MKKSEIYKLMDILDDVKKIDSMILLHNSLDNSSFMVSQYEAKKIKLIGSLIDGLASPEIQSPQSFTLIEMILQKFYPTEDRTFEHDDDIAQLAASL